jgi:hypothetical protein
MIPSSSPAARRSPSGESAPNKLPPSAFRSISLCDPSGDPEIQASFPKESVRDRDSFRSSGAQAPEQYAPMSLQTG